MIIRRRSGIKRKGLWLSFGLVIAALAIYLICAAAFDFWPLQAKSNPQNSDSLPSPKTAYPSPKNNNVPTKNNPQPVVDSGKTSNQIPVSPTMTATITDLEESNQQIHFSASVSNASSAGTCVVTFSNPNDRPVTKQVAATYAGSTSTCGPLTLSANEFSYIGTWQVSLHYYEGTQQAGAEGSVVIK